MEETENFNFSSVVLPRDGVRSFPRSPFPAWVPAVTVAIGMLAFLAGSFYLRHRKVVKKRQILMDYFYIIFQYGGLRRKRMVTALCNTNSITLRELGRSFMISCDSTANGDNSCPFYLEDSAFSNHYGQPRAAVQKKNAFFKNRGFTITKRYKGPFHRFKSQQSEDNPNPYSMTFQDIVMKFRTKRPHSHHATAESALKRHHLPPPQFEGCSMCTIHGDDFDFHSCIEEDEMEPTAHYNRQRRNAFIVQNDSQAPRFDEVTPEVGKHSLGHGPPERFRAQQAPYSGKRNSEPWHNLQNINSDSSQNQEQQPGVFHVYGNSLSPANVVCGSHGYIPSVNEQNSSFQSYRNSEPTILVHSPSAGVDADTSRAWSDIRSRYTNGVVFLKRVPKPDGAPGEFYYEEQNTSSNDSSSRASLSKVNYVPSGNMNNYCNSFISHSKENNKKDDATGHKTSKGKNVPSKSAHDSSRTKRFRLGLGNLAVSSFNRRIDLASESLQDYEPDQSTEKRTSKDTSPKQKPAHISTWARFKNVFSGSRASQSGQSQDKSTKSFTSTEDGCKKTAREGTRWQRFVSVFTGFRSLPESKKIDVLIDFPKLSNSCPMGLNNIVNSKYGNLGKTELQFGPYENMHIRNLDSHINAVSSTAVPATLNGRKIVENERECGVASSRDQQRPVNLQVQSNTHSFSKDFIDSSPHFQRFKTMINPGSRTAQNETLSRLGTRRFRNSNQDTASSVPQSRKYLKSYSFEAGYHMSPGEYRFRGFPQLVEGKPRVQTPGRLEGNDDGFDFPVFNRRFRSLSPLPEVNCAGQNKDDLCTLDPNINLGSVLAQSVYLTPLESDNLLLDIESDVKSGELLNSTDYLKQQYPTVRSNADIHNEDTPYFITKVSSTQHLVDNESSYVKDIPSERVKSREFTCTNESSVSSLNDEICLPPKTIYGCRNSSSSQIFQLTNPASGSYLSIQHRHAGLSTDSVYYDTVSALGSPSPVEPKELLSFTPSPSLPNIPLKLEDNCCTLSTLITGNREVKGTCSECSIVLDSSGFDFTSRASSVTSNTEHVSPQTSSATSLPWEFVFCPSNEPCGNQISDHSDTPHCQAQSSTAVLSVAENFYKLPDKSPECNSSNFVPKHEHEIRTIIPACNSYCPKQLSQNLPVPSMNTCSIELNSCESSPQTSRPTTPSRRHSTPSPSPERSQSRLSGYGSIDEIYVANFARLPRFCQRTGHNSTVSKGAVDSLC